MPEPVTMIAVGLGYLMKKKLLVIGGKAIFGHGAAINFAATNAVAIGHFAAAHAAALAAITGGLVFGAVLGDVADILAASAASGVMTKSEEGAISTGRRRPILLHRRGSGIGW